MFEGNSRIEYDNGLRFYEKDVLVGENIYNYDTEYHVTLDYNSSGFGIMLINQDTDTEDKNEYYLFRIGNREFGLEYHFEALHKTIKSASINVYAPTKGLQFSLAKKNGVVTIVAGGYTYSYVLPSDFEKYKIAVYSSKGNVIKYVSVNTSVPSEWMVNNAESNNGNVVFERDQFTLANCNEMMSISQDEIKLLAGTYYLKYDLTEGSDIEAEVLVSGRNIADENGKFQLGTDGAVGILFKGKNGTVSRVQITNYALDKYMRTHSDEININGSKIAFDVSGVTSLEATFTLYSFYGNDYYIVNDGSKSYSCTDLNMRFNDGYTFKYYNNLKMLYVYNSAETLVKSLQLSSSTKTLGMFYNVSGSMTELNIKFSNGESYSPIIFKTKKNSVPGAIISPVIIVDQNDVPFDLSASYRLDEGKYKFTNMEREYFNPENKITLTKKPLESDGTLKVYGIKEDVEMDYTKMLTNTDGIDCIDALTKNYETLYENDMLYVDKKKGELYIEDVSKYKLLIVDYLKKDSYCINYDYNTQSYVVDVATAKEEYYTMYDYESSSDGKKSVQGMNRYKLTDISPENNTYITIRRSELA